MAEDVLLRPSFRDRIPKLPSIRPAQPMRLNRSMISLLPSLHPLFFARVLLPSRRPKTHKTGRPRFPRACALADAGKGGNRKPPPMHRKRTSSLLRLSSDASHVRRGGGAPGVCALPFPAREICLYILYQKNGKCGGIFPFTTTRASSLRRTSVSYLQLCNITKKWKCGNGVTVYERAAGI